MRFTETTKTDRQGQKFHIREWLPEKDIKGLAFLLHGLSDHGGRYSHVAEAFTRKGIAFIAPDLRGNGLSGGKRGHFPSYTLVMDDIEFLLNETIKKFPGIPVIIYGQSMGGNLALNFGIRRNPAVAGIISSSPWLRLAVPPSAFTRIAGNIIGSLIPSLVIPNGLNAGELCRNKKVSDAYRNDPLVHGKISLNTYKVIAGSGEWAILHASELKLPLLLMHGTADRITSMEASRQFAANLNNKFEFKTWESGFHELHNEPEQDQVIAYMLNWIENTVRSNNSAGNPG